MKMSRPPTKAQLNRILQSAIKAAAVKAVSIIKARTAKGQSMDGGTFDRYSPSYRAAKAGSGRNVDPPDLTVTGETLGALKLLWVENPHRAIIGWSGGHRRYSFRLVRTKAGVAKKTKDGVKRYRVEKQAGTVPYASIVPALHARRPFFGLKAAEERAILVRVYKEAIERGLREIASNPNK